MMRFPLGSVSGLNPPPTCWDQTMRSAQKHESKSSSFYLDPVKDVLTELYTLKNRGNCPLQADLISYTAAISACAGALEWQRAVLWPGLFITKP